MLSKDAQIELLHYRLGLLERELEGAIRVLKEISGLDEQRIVPIVPHRLAQDFLNDLKRKQTQVNSGNKTYLG